MGIVKSLTKNKTNKNNKETTLGVPYLIEELLKNFVLNSYYLSTVPLPSMICKDHQCVSKGYASYFFQLARIIKKTLRHLEATTKCLGGGHVHRNQTKNTTEITHHGKALWDAIL